MIERYSRPEMAAIWTDENRFQAWLEVEILACEAWAELGVIPKEDVKVLREKASFDINRILEIEQDTRHDVVAFTRAVSETLGEEKKWVHYGLTSTDVVDTALSYLLKQANEILLKDIERFIDILKEKAKEHKYTVMMGRTHGVHAEPTTFGLKLALWYEEMKRNLERFKQAKEGIEVGKISGAVGTYANIDPFVEQYVCEKLGLKAAPISTQTLQRDTMGIATSNSRELAEIVLDKHNIKDYFDSIRTSCQVDKGKPYPDVYLQVAKDLQVEAEKCLVFEDVPQGIMAGKNANMKVCAVYDEHSKKDTEQKKRLAEYYIHSMKELSKYFD